MSVAQFGGAAEAVADTGGEPPKRRGRAGYLLLLPGMLWLIIFFVLPTIQLVGTSLYDPNGSLNYGYDMTWSFGNYADALGDYVDPFLRSLYYALSATILAILLGYPLAYAIAFKAGRWRNLMLIAVIAPFFTSFLVRTLAWKSILSDNGFVVNILQCAAHPRPGRPAAGHLGGGRDRPDLQLPAVHGAAAVRQPGEDRPPADRGGQGPLRQQRSPRSARSPCRCRCRGVVAGTLLTFIPAAGDYINAKLLGTPRQYMIGNVIDNTVPGPARLPGGRGLLGRPDGRDRAAGARLRPPRRDGGAAVITPRDSSRRSGAPLTRCSRSAAGSASTSSCSSPACWSTCSCRSPSWC